MPEYLAPGVYVEETSYRAKSIEGVATSTCGFVGQASYGPIEGTPVLVTSFEEYRRRFGGVGRLLIGGVESPNYLALAVRSFFENGGKRVYISRVYNPPAADVLDPRGATDPDVGYAWQAAGPLVTAGPLTVRFAARYPGRDGDLQVKAEVVRSRNVLAGGKLNGVRKGDTVEIRAGALTDDQLKVPVTAASLVGSTIAFVEVSDSGTVALHNQGGAVAMPAGGVVYRLTIRVEAASKVTQLGGKPDRVDSYRDLSPHVDSDQFIGEVLRREDPDNDVAPPADRAARLYLHNGREVVTDALSEGLLAALVAMGTVGLTGGRDGAEPTITQYTGGGSGNTATGLVALGEVDDISIVAAPGSQALTGSTPKDVRDLLIGHCERLQYRFAILSAPAPLDIPDIRQVRAEMDSTYAALYYPWCIIADPNGNGQDELFVPPDGFIAGIYARSDVQRGVHKAPANEVVRGIRRFSRHIDKGTQDVLNPEGINCLRAFEGRGNRVWGARTISSDPEWKYVNVRRLFIFLEHSIDKNTQWAVFEPNNEKLWLKVRLTVESFLVDVWRTGALMGTKPGEAFFVRCDRTTMTQGDLDNGRLICLIGVAPTKPAEYVIFRIGQWTADAQVL